MLGPAVVALAASLAVCVPAAAQQPLDLKVVAPKGATVWLLDESKETTVFSSGEQDFETGKTKAIVLQMTVKDVDDKGCLVVETRIARIYGGLALPNATIDFDSAAPTDDDDDEGEGEGMTMGGIRKAMLVGAGKAFTAKVDPAGAVVELLDDAKAAVEDGVAAARAGMETLTRADLQDIVRRAFGERPAQPTAIGGTWSPKATTAAAMGPAKVRRELTLAKADGGSFEVAIAGALDATKDADAAATGDDGPKVKEAKASGSCRVSRADGFVLEASESAAVLLDQARVPGGLGSVSRRTTRSIKRTTAEAAAPQPAAAKPPAPASDGARK